MQLCYKNTVNNLSLDLLFTWDEENWPRDVEYKLNPLSRKTDQHQISPCNINSVKQISDKIIMQMITQDSSQFNNFFPQL